MLDSVVKVNKKHYPQILLEECEYEPKKINIENLIDDNLEKFHLMNRIIKLIMILMMKRNLMIIMMNLINYLLKAKKVF